MVTVRGNTVDFLFFRPQAQDVQVVGDFNEWSVGETPMVRTSDGYWQTCIKLPPGDFKFRYCADGDWFTDYAAFGLEYGRFGPDSIIHVSVKSDTPSN